jgi:hypothetical protein
MMCYPRPEPGRASCCSAHVRLRTASAALVIALLGALVVAADSVFGGGRSAGARHTADAGPSSTDPYTASLRYARCMRQHGVPHPDPDSRGDFSLTRADEKRMRAVEPKKREAADNACFHHLKGLNLSPLSRHAIALATKVVEDLGRCLRGHGHEVGPPEVRNLGRGRAFFGFNSRPGRDREYWQSVAARREMRRLQRDQHTCEKRVKLAARLSKIIADDRRIPAGV